VLEAHLAFARAVTPAGHVHALAADALVDPTVTLHSARRDGRVVAVGALRQLADDHVELKSMHTLRDARSRGVGQALLDHLLEAARERRIRRISLETGTYPAFAAARRLYVSTGFVPCAPFASHTDNRHSVCMTRPVGGLLVVGAATQELTRTRLDQIRRLCVAAFDGEFSDDDWGHTLGGRHCFALDGGEVVAHGAVVGRRLVAGTTELRAGYVEGVATAPARRGEGLGRTVMEALQQHVVKSYDIGALSTGVHEFYRRLGWTPWQGPTYVATAHGLRRTPEDDDGIMVLRHGRHSALDPTRPLVCEERPGDDW
jgi:aminoglycoside 2'-N-acetyltransferase I